MYSLRTAAMLLACIMGALVLVLVVVTIPAWATPRYYYYYDEQLLNYRMTEFCSVVKKPPKALTDALEEWLKLDAKAALPAVLWLNSIAEEYQRAKCGDA